MIVIIIITTTNNYYNYYDYDFDLLQKMPRIGLLEKEDTMYPTECPPRMRMEVIPMYHKKDSAEEFSPAIQ